MKRIIILLIISQFSITNLFGQLIVTGGIPNELTEQTIIFSIDTLRLEGDSAFIVVTKIESGILTFEEEQFFVNNQNERKIIFHGRSRQWYPNGSKKSEGYFKFGKKTGLWKYWDEKGNLTQDTDLIIRGRGSENGYIFIDGEKVMIRKE